MRGMVAIGIAAVLLTATSTRSAAQDEGDVAAWFAMMFSPYGALPPVATEAMAGIPRPAGTFARILEIRYGRWAFDEDDDKFNTIGIGGRAGPVGFVVGYEKCDECDAIILAGVDF